MRHLRRWITWTLALGGTLTLWACTLRGQPDATGAFAAFTRDWRDDDAWHDGKAECAVYDATREVYSQVRAYQAVLYTNHELADPQTKTKSARNTGRAVFKHHLREDIPTENYTYHYSTMGYIGAADLKSLKIDMGSQEDCGATFKQFINHGGEMTWAQFSYFPDEGRREGAAAPPVNFAFQDALSFILRGYPFERPVEMTLMLLPDQTSNRLTPTQAQPHRVRYLGRETLDVPLGRFEAHHVEASPVTGDGSSHDYWFAADTSPPMMHVMLRYEGPGGQTYALRKLERRAYWQR
jgi:hypothetical protein